MSHTQPTPQGMAGEARISDDHDLANPDGEDETTAHGAGTTSGQSLPAAPTSGASIQHGGWCWDGHC